jgi:hypothetical protein
MLPPAPDFDWARRRDRASSRPEAAPAVALEPPPEGTGEAPRPARDCCRRRSIDASRPLSDMVFPE